MKRVNGINGQKGHIVQLVIKPTQHLLERERDVISGMSDLVRILGVIFYIELLNIIFSLDLKAHEPF